jgi:lipoprotein-anchoring transpeptidase ErfK/SrfK
MIVSVTDQRMLLVHDGKPVKSYSVSTSKFGIGSERGSNRTPLGRMEVARKIGDGAPSGMVFKSRRPTGEVLRPNAPGRDPIVSRIMWLNGTETHNRNTYGRCVYIHGTPEEWRLGSPASYGCIRMGMKDVVDLYDRIGEGAEVRVMRGSLLETWAGQEYVRKHSSEELLGVAQR